MKTLLIDGDAIAYILGWKFREYVSGDEHLMEYSVDQFIASMLQLHDATHYIGALGTNPTFRHQLYRFAPYKGTRKEPDDWVRKWKPLVNARLVNHWQFTSIDYLEADDIVAWSSTRKDLGEIVICSPDKDLNQMPGMLYNYQTGEMRQISPEEAKESFQMQMLTGDTTDNIKGIPGLGPVKARKKLDESGVTLLQLYVDYFGQYYGQIIYTETLGTVQLLQPGHDYESYFDRYLDAIQPVEYNLNSSVFEA
jgi:DNA polymerase-1